MPGEAAGGPRPSFLITIDTEGDDLWARPTAPTTRNARFLPRFQALCEAHGLKPTYLTNYEMALCPEFVEFARDARGRGAAEIGMHLHAWDSPPIVPLTEDDSEHHPYLFEFEERLIREKVGYMTDLLESTFGEKMVSHRAGRWGFDEVYARALADRGYLVDCSVTPHVSWSPYPGDPRRGGGRDFTGYPERAYFLDLHDIREPGSSSLLEVPMTIVRPRHSLINALHRRFRGGPRLVRGPLCRAFPPISWLRPNGRNLRHMIAILNRAIEERRDYVEFTLHSSEFMPGGSPTFRTERDIERLYEHMERLFAAAARDFKGATMSDYYEEFSRRQPPGGPVLGSDIAGGDAAPTGRAGGLHVAHVVLSLDVGGLERNVVNQVRVASEFGQRVTILCLERPGALAGRAEALGARVVCLDKRPGLRPGTIRALRRLLTEIRPDVVHTHQLATLFYGGLAARAAGVPLVVHTEHGRERYADRPRTRWLGRLGGLCAARFYCLTRDMAAEVERHGIVPRGKLCVIHNGIDTAQYRRGAPGPVRASLGIPERAQVIGTVGRLTEIKRQDVLLRAFARVRTEVPDAHLLLVGDGPLMGDLRALADELGLGGSIHLVGYQAEAWRYLHIMDLFVLCSRSEGMPQAVLEASVAGIPVVATRVGGLPEVIDDGRTGLLVEPGDEAGLAAALLRLCGDPALARRLGEAGRGRVESLFDIRRMAGEYHEHYMELVGRAPAPALAPNAAS